MDVVERAARCTKCKGKSISSVPVICIEGSFDAMHSSHTPKDHKDWGINDLLIGKYATEKISTSL